jgi:hypothetical protein
VGGGTESWESNGTYYSRCNEKENVPFALSFVLDRHWKLNA